MKSNLAEDQYLIDPEVEIITESGQGLTGKQGPIQIAPAPVPTQADFSDSGTADSTDADAESQETPNTATGQAAISPEDEAEALAFLRDSNLVNIVRDDIGRLGHVGEPDLRLIVYLIGLSCQLGALNTSRSRPLSLIIKGDSAIGKSHLMEKGLSCIPPEWKVDMSSLSAKALVYMAQDSLKNKIITVAEHVGSEDSDYYLRTLISEGVIRHNVTVKTDEGFVTQQIEMQGPVALVQTTTLVNINPENESRLLEIHPDDSSNQTERILNQQKWQRTYEGITASSEGPAILRKHHNALRLLKPVEVVIEYAPQLKFNARTSNPRVRRDFEKLLNLITVIAYLRQNQKELKALPDSTPYVEADIEDYRIVYDLASSVFSAALDDLPPKSRELLEDIKRYSERVTGCINRKGIRDATGMPEATLRKYIKPLEDNGYLTIIDGGIGGKTVTYDSNIDTRSAAELGLINPDELSALIKKQK